MLPLLGLKMWVFLPELTVLPVLLKQNAQALLAVA